MFQLQPTDMILCDVPIDPTFGFGVLLHLAICPEAKIQSRRDRTKPRVALTSFLTLLHLCTKAVHAGVDSIAVPAKLSAVDRFIGVFTPVANSSGREGREKSC